MPIFPLLLGERNHGPDSRMIDHIIISVSNLETSKAFYRKALASIGYKTSPEYISGSTKTKGVGFGGEDLEFFIVQGPVIKPPFHMAFRVSSRAQVKAFTKRRLRPVAVIMAHRA